MQLSLHQSARVLLIAPDALCKRLLSHAGCLLVAALIVLFQVRCGFASEPAAHPISGIQHTQPAPAPVSVAASPTEPAPTVEIQVRFVGYGAVDLTPSGPYTVGQSIQAVAVPALGWRFEQWSGAVISYKNPVDFAITANEVLSATFVPVAAPPLTTIVTEVAGNGRIELMPSGEYTVAQVITATAVAADGWRFDHWQGDADGADNPLSYTIEGDATLVAVFVPTPPTEPIQLELITQGEGALSALPVAPYSSGDPITLTAAPAEGWQFTGWSGDLSGQANPYLLILLTDTVAVAAFESTSPITNVTWLTVTMNISGDGQVEFSPSPPYTVGEPITLTATAVTGWQFGGWRGDLIAQANPVTFAPQRSQVITAVFDRIQPSQQYTLALHTQGEGVVSVFPALPGPYELNQLATLTAIAAEGWTFMEWMGDLHGSNNPATVIITGNLDITAVFTTPTDVTPVSLRVTATGPGYVAVDPVGPYHRGQVVTVAAHPALGYCFQRWEGEHASQANPVTFPIMADTSLIAQLSPCPVRLPLVARTPSD